MNHIPDLSIKHLGGCHIDSPLISLATGRARTPTFVGEYERILFDDEVLHIAAVEGLEDLPSLEMAGPRRKLFFDPPKTRIGIVTCGGLCPGMNDVIRGLVMEAYHHYGVRHIYGYRFGFQGLVADHGHDVLELEPGAVSNIHEDGGTILGSSRGPQDTARIVDCLERMSVGILFVIGGDGTLRGSLDIAEEADRRGLKLAVVGIPKTIDNDIRFIDRSFGYETAYSTAVAAIRSAHTEAMGALNGVGLVKIMGRHSGFLACHAALATSHVNFVLIPEMPFGRNAGAAFLEALHRRLEQRRHAVILVAEGAGQEYLQADPSDTDASGNVKLKDIGGYLAERIKEHLSSVGMESSLKYIDPSYIIRSVPARPPDSVYCWRLAQNAVHAAMAGKTEMVVGEWHGRLVHVPTRAAISSRKEVDTEGELWLSVLESTAQPAVFEKD